MTTLYSQHEKGLLVGPGNKGDAASTVQFVGGYADIDPTDPNLADKLAWCLAVPGVRVVEEGEPTSAEQPSVACPECGKAFATDKALNGHLIQHRRK